MTVEPIEEPERHLYAVPDEPRGALADVDAEQAVLGAMMLSTRAADDVIEILRSDDFYQPRHSTIYAVILGAMVTNQPTDPTAVAHLLGTVGDLAKVGGGAYLHTLLASVPTAANAAYYARIVAEYAQRRRMVEVAVQIGHLANDLGREVPDAVNAAQVALHSATVRAARSSVDSVGDLLDATLEEVLSEDGRQRGLSTGLGSLDDAIGGLKPGQLVIPAGRPGVGKSVLGIDFARAAALRRNVPVAVFSLEMSKHELMCRILAAECNVNLGRILNGGLYPEERARLTGYPDRIRKAPLFVDDTAPNDLASIRATSRRIQQSHGLGLIVVDYLQLVSPAVRRDSRVQEVTEVSSGLKLLAKELGVPIVAACQLNRSSEQRSDKRPQISDLRESGSIEQDADIVILLHRPDYHDPEHERAGEIDLILGKHRNGAQETITCAAQLDKARIVDFELRDEAR